MDAITVTPTHYQKYKETILRVKAQWVKNQPHDEFREYMRPIVRKSVKKHYENNKAKILEYKRQHYQKKKALKEEAFRLFGMYDAVL
jgi:hypothetical protein